MQLLIESSTLGQGELVSIFIALIEFIHPGAPPVHAARLVGGVISDGQKTPFQPSQKLHDHV
jgi:hypothetical protein